MEETGNSGKRRSLKRLGSVPVEINRSLSPSPKLTSVQSTLIHRTHGALARGGTTTARQRSLAPDFGLIDTSGNNTVARQRALVCDSLNDEQWSNDLSDP